MVLMGPPSAGKTSMNGIIFANVKAQETTKFQSTISLQRSSIRFMGNMNFSLWDCPTQKEFLYEYFTTQSEYIFSQVSVLVFVLDATSKTIHEDWKQFSQCVEFLSKYSYQAKLFALIHKMDLVPERDKNKIFEAHSSKLQSMSKHFNITCFQTSIWEETLYKAWSAIVNSLIPNAELIKQRLTEFMNNIEAEEVILFEKSSFLHISHTTRNEDLFTDIHRIERISNIVKMFKISCLKGGTNNKSILVENSKFTALLQEFTQNSYILVITVDPEVNRTTTTINIQTAIPQFEKLLTQNPTE
uniref:GTP-binding protein n=1 Tax=Arcella intermedia TaxID=1963864 RepID=A0A6B2LB61_9EUKA